MEDMTILKSIVLTKTRALLHCRSKIFQLFKVSIDTNFTDKFVMHQTRMKAIKMLLELMTGKTTQSAHNF